MNRQTPKNASVYPHYFKDVSGYTHIDIYRTLDIWGVTRPALHHAAKKILVAGNRGPKDRRRDIQEAIDALNRELEMMAEDSAGEPSIGGHSQLTVTAQV